MKRYDSCPSCGSYRDIEHVDGMVACSCGWSGGDSDLCERVTEDQLRRALAQGDKALEMLREEEDRSKKTES